ncbi:TOBE domain-containing protein, partial [Mesorhizobium sp. M2D.F.Ca.ET.140.01.1.1]
YFGTDTHIRVQLNSGEAFTVRQQNTRSAGCGFQCGDKVGISIGNDAAQVLRD